MEERLPLSAPPTIWRRSMSDKWLEFLQNIYVECADEFELEELKEAIRAERRKGNPRPNGHELLEEIRAKWATKH